MVETARSPPDCRCESRRVRGSASLLTGVLASIQVVGNGNGQEDGKRQERQALTGI